MDKRNSSGRPAVPLRQQGVQNLVLQAGAGWVRTASVRSVSAPGSDHVLSAFQEAEALVAAVLPAEKAAAAPEISVYLKEAVGNPTRIDYGTGTGLDQNLCTPCFPLKQSEVHYLAINYKSLVFHLPALPG